MDPPVQVEGLSNANLNFFCYKNFVTGVVRTKVNNFESILRTTHTYPVCHLKLVLKVAGSSLTLLEGKAKENKTVLPLDKLERVAYKEQAKTEEHEIEDQKERSRRSSLGRLLNRVLNNHHDDYQHISTRFGFELKTVDKTYTFFTCTKEEALVWQRVIDLIIQMKTRGV